MNKKLDEIIIKYQKSSGGVIEILQELQELESYISKDSLKYISEKTGIPAAELWGVATFYSMFRLKPRGKHLIKVCKGTACHVSGADNIASALRTHLKLGEDEDTTADGLFTLAEVACLGCCSLAPVMIIDDTVYYKLTPHKAVSTISKYIQAEGS